MPDSKTCTLVLLSFNEKESLEQLIGHIHLADFDSVFAVDGGSDDGTLGVYEDAGIAVHIQKEKGRGHAFTMAEKLVQTDLVVFFSTDGNEDPKDLPTMLRFLREGYDMVIAGRYRLDGSLTDDSDDPLLFRKTAGIMGGLIVHLLWRTGVRDPINGYRGFSILAMNRLKLDAPSHDIELQSTIRAGKLGLRVKEFPTKELKRMAGDRKSSAGTLRLTFNLGVALLREIAIGKKF